MPTWPANRRRGREIVRRAKSGHSELNRIAQSLRDGEKVKKKKKETISGDEGNGNGLKIGCFMMEAMVSRLNFLWITAADRV